MRSSRARRVVRGATLGLALLLGSSAIVFAAGGALDPRFAEHAGNDVGNQDSLRRGARNFMNYCSGCHSAKYVRYNTLADGLGLSEEQVIENLMFTGEKIHDTILVNMPADDAKNWFGVAPPDLSLIARSRGADHIYNFLRSYYVDDSRATGVNNMVIENVAMPNVLWELQGIQRARFKEETDANGNVIKVFDDFEEVTQGTLSPEEFDQWVRDTVNFLDYIGEPMQLERRSIGIKVLLFLAFFFVIAYMLKKEIWKDVK
ncbi:MAG: cytochrome c1 [Pseudomonadota bacterium]